MRISQSTKDSMQSKILIDLYNRAEKDLANRKAAIAGENYELWIAPFEEILKQLPAALVSTTSGFIVSINFKENSESLKETWKFTFPPGKEKWGPIMKERYGSPPDPQKLSPKLYAKAAIVARESIKLTNEKDKMEKYLQDTLNTYSGPKQLRQIWPSTLHKYLPAMPVRGPRIPKDKAELPAKLAAPAELKTRLTTNLLEG